MRISKVTDGHIIRALAQLLYAANDFAPENDPDRYDAWRAMVVSARCEYDALCAEVRAALAESEGTCPSDALDALDALERWYREDQPPAPASRDGQGETPGAAFCRACSHEWDTRSAVADGEHDRTARDCRLWRAGPDEGTGGGR